MQNIDNEYEYIQNIINNTDHKLNYNIEKSDIITLLNKLNICDNFTIIHNYENIDYYCTNELFNSERISYVPIEKYTESILKYSECSIEHLIISIIYLKRLLNTKKIVLTKNNIHYLILISIVLAIFYLDDEHYSVNIYAKYSKISSINKINEMLIKYLNLINWNIYI
jgi:hypothetical protein